MAAITPDVVDAYIGQLQRRGLSAGTIRSIYGALRAALSTAVRFRIWRRTPARGPSCRPAARLDALPLGRRVGALAEAHSPHYLVMIYG